jgi:hypothetical protein
MSAPSEGPVIGICAVRERARWSFWDQPAHLVADSRSWTPLKTKPAA